jgi:hypothetical protein
LPKRRTQRQRRIAAESARREAHARLVAQRAQDPEYVHRERSEDGYVVSVPPGSRAASELESAVEGQRERFREQFGRRWNRTTRFFGIQMQMNQLRSLMISSRT